MDKKPRNSEENNVGGIAMKLKKIIGLIPCFYFPFIVFLLHIFILSPSNLYTKFLWIDIPLHFLGGFSIAYSFILILRKLDKEIVINNKLVRGIIILGFVALGA